MTHWFSSIKIQISTCLFVTLPKLTQKTYVEKESLRHFWRVRLWELDIRNRQTNQSTKTKAHIQIFTYRETWYTSGSTADQWKKYLINSIVLVLVVSVLDHANLIVQFLANKGCASKGTDCNWFLQQDSSPVSWVPWKV